MLRHKLAFIILLLALLNLASAQYGTKGGRKSPPASTPSYTSQENEEVLDEFEDLASFEEQKPMNSNYGNARRPAPASYAAKKIYAPKSYGGINKPRNFYSGVQYAPSSTPSTLSDNFKFAAKQSKKLTGTPDKKIPVLAEIKPFDEDEEETLPADTLFDQPSLFRRNTSKPRVNYSPVKFEAKSYAPKSKKSPPTGYGEPLAKRKLNSALYGGFQSSTPAPLFFDEVKFEQHDERQQQQLDEFPEEQLSISYPANKPKSDIEKPNYSHKSNYATKFKNALKPTRAFSMFGQTTLNFDHEEEQPLDDDFLDEQQKLSQEFEHAQQEIDVTTSYGKSSSYATGGGKPKYQQKSKPPSNYGGSTSYAPQFQIQNYGSGATSKPKLVYGAKDNENDKSKVKPTYGSDAKQKKSYTTPNYGVKGGKPNYHGTKGVSQLDVRQAGNGMAFKMMEFSMGQDAIGAQPKSYTPDYSPARAYNFPTGRAYDTVSTDPTPLVEEVPFDEDDFLRPLEPLPPQDEAEDELNNAELNVELLNPLTLEPVSAASRQSNALVKKLKAASTAAASNARGVYSNGSRARNQSHKYVNAIFLKNKAKAWARARGRARAAAAAKAAARAKARARARAAA